MPPFLITTRPSAAVFGCSLEIALNLPIEHLNHIFTLSIFCLREAMTELVFVELPFFLAVVSEAATSKLIEEKLYIKCKQICVCF